MTTCNLADFLARIEGASIAIVYAFRNEESIGLSHYDYWKSEVISDWLCAIEEIGGVPYICDVKTFCTKALEFSLPKLDYVINLNAGNASLESLALVQSICGVSNLTCIPNRIAQVVTGEHKGLSNLIAKGFGFKVPDRIGSNEYGIAKPVSMGSSVGVEMTSKPCSEKIKQRFIEGYDISTPIIYDPVSKAMKVLPSIYYVADNLSTRWFHSAESKSSGHGYTKHMHCFNDSSQNKIIDFVECFGVRDYCRIDWRFECKDLESVVNKPIDLEDVYFIEINTMPTITNNTNFVESYSTYSCTSDFHTIYRNLIKKHTNIGEILFSSLYSANYNQAL